MHRARARGGRRTAPATAGTRLTASCTARWRVAPATGQVHSPSTSTRRMPGDSSQRRIFSVSSAVAAGHRARAGAGPSRPTAAASRRRRRRRRPAGSPRRRPAGRGVRRGPPSGPSSSRRAATISGQRVSAESRWVRAAARTKAASRSRWTPASSNRSSAASAAIRRVDRVDDLVRAPEQRVAQLPDDRGVRRLVDAAVAGGEAPAHLGQHAGAAASRGSRAIRSEHWRIGNVSCSAARHFSAVFFDENGPR